MAPGIGASGIMGIALETVSGTYLAPTKYVPFYSESLKYEQDTNWRRPIRQTPDVVGAVAGDSFVNGDIDMEALHDCVPYFLMAARATFIKTGAGPYVYTYTPSASAVPLKTLSITIVRNGIVFAYTGCAVGGFTFSIDKGTLMFKPDIVGRDEAVQSVPTPTWPTSVPFGAGSYSLQIPTASQVFDADTFEFKVDDKAEPQYRLKNTGTGAQFIKFGERDVNIKSERDFDARTDYDAFKALTAQSVTLAATQGANIISLAAATSIKDTYEVNLDGQGDLVRGEVEYIGTLGAGNSYGVAITTSENIS
jgi:Phage tail tube protein